MRRNIIVGFDPGTTTGIAILDTEGNLLTVISKRNIGIKKVVEMGMSVQRFSGSLPNPILSKLDKEHITKILEQGEKEEENLYKDKQSTKKYNLIYFILILLLIVFLVIYLANENKDLLLEIIKYVVIVAGSFGGGYGYKAYKDRSSD